MPGKKGSRSSSSQHSEREGYNTDESSNSISSGDSFILVPRKAKKLVKTTVVPKTNGTGSSENAKNVTLSEKGGSSPVASTSTQRICERVITFMDEEDEKPWVEHTNVDRCSRSEIAGNGAAEQRERNQGASTSTQLQPEVESILGDEIYDVEMENTDAAQKKSIPLATFVADKQPAMRRSKRTRFVKRVDLRSSQETNQIKKGLRVPVPKPHEKFFEGCLVKAPLYLPGYPLWPAMIRKPGAFDVRHSDYIAEMDGETVLCIQFFTELTVVRWRLPRELRLFDSTKPNRCYSSEMESTEVEELEKAVRIAKAAANYSVEARLVKFTFPDSFPDLTKLDMDGLLAEVEGVNSHQNAVAAEVSHNDGVSVVRDENSAVTRVKNRMLDTRKKLRETEEVNRSLTTENSQLGEKINELEATVKDLKRQLNLHTDLTTVVISQQKNLKLKDSALKAQEKDILKLRAENFELRENLEKEREEKRECQRKLEETTSDFEKLDELLDDDMEDC